MGESNKPKKAKKVWTKEEEEFITSTWGTKTVQEYMDIFKVENSVILNKICRMKLDVTKLSDYVPKRKWTAEEDEILKKYHNKIPFTELEKMLGRTRVALNNRASKLGISEDVGRLWTEEDNETLHELWGKRKLLYISKKIGRSLKAIKFQAIKLGLENYATANGAYLSTRDIWTILDLNEDTVRQWFKKGIIKSRKITLVERKFYRVQIEDFLEFLEKHPDRWDSKKADIETIKTFIWGELKSDGKSIDSNSLPLWLKEKISNDRIPSCKQREWTIKEVQKLLDLKSKGYKNTQIATFLNRTRGSVANKLSYIAQKNKIKHTA